MGGMTGRWFQNAVVLPICLVLFGCGDGEDVSPEAEVVVEDVEPKEQPTKEQVPVDWSDLDNPAADGWETEAFSEQAGSQLKKLGKLFFEEGKTGSILAPGFACHELIPPRQESTFENELVTVERLEKTREGGALEESLKRIRDEVLGDEDSKRFKFKIVRVSRKGGRVLTEQYFSISYQVEGALIEIHSRWLVGWLQEGDEEPKMASIEVLDFERTTTRSKDPLFTDVTSAVLGKTECYHEQLSHGLNHWLERLPVRAMLNRFGTPGLALGDVNGDGLDDLYLCQEPGLPNRLFLQDPDGTAREVSREWGVDWIDDSRSALLLDLDNDGDQDLVAAVFGAIVIARNEEGKRFEIAGAFPTSGSTASLASADYDGDGLLDLYVCAYVLSDDGSAIGVGGERFVYHDARNGAPNSLFRNVGGLAFKEVTGEVGLSANNHGWSFAASWEDFDNDGDQDLYVANDYGRNNLYRNDGGKFTDIAREAGVEDSASGMAASWGDYDRDGWMDLHVSNMFSAAGNRVVTQEQFRPGSDEELRGRFLRFARGNTLFKNEGGGRFADVSEDAGVTLGRWAWGSALVDLNNDAWKDIVVANGYLSSDEDSGDL